MLIALGLVGVLLAAPNSSINFALDKTQKQEKVGEARFETAGVMLDDFNHEPTYWITGVGMFNYKLLKGNTKLSSYHNSYWEGRCGFGIPGFLVFLSFMVFKPVTRFLKYYSSYTLLLPPLLILPFFESNSTGGQFLFFPWFSFMLLLNAKTRFWNKKSFDASEKRRKIITQSDLIINEADHSVL